MAFNFGAFAGGAATGFRNEQQTAAEANLRNQQAQAEQIQNTSLQNYQNAMQDPQAQAGATVGGDTSTMPVYDNGAMNGPGVQTGTRVVPTAALSALAQHQGASPQNYSAQTPEAAAAYRLGAAQQYLTPQQLGQYNSAGEAQARGGYFGAAAGKTNQDVAMTQAGLDAVHGVSGQLDGLFATANSDPVGAYNQASAILSKLNVQVPAPDKNGMVTLNGQTFDTKNPLATQALIGYGTAHAYHTAYAMNNPAAMPSVEQAGIQQAELPSKIADNTSRAAVNTATANVAIPARATAETAQAAETTARAQGQNISNEDAQRLSDAQAILAQHQGDPTWMNSPEGRAVQQTITMLAPGGAAARAYSSMYHTDTMRQISAQKQAGLKAAGYVQDQANPNVFRNKTNPMQSYIFDPQSAQLTGVGGIKPPQGTQTDPANGLPTMMKGKQQGWLGGDGAWHANPQEALATYENQLGGAPQQAGISSLPPPQVMQQNVPQQ